MQCSERGCYTFCQVTPCSPVQPCAFCAEFNSETTVWRAALCTQTMPSGTANAGFHSSEGAAHLHHLLRGWQIWEETFYFQHWVILISFLISAQLIFSQELMPSPGMPSAGFDRRGAMRSSRLPMHHPATWPSAWLIGLVETKWKSTMGRSDLSGE